MALDPSLERPRRSSDPGFSDAVTCAFSDPGTGVHGTIRIGIAAGIASGLVMVFAGGAPVLTHAEGGVALPEPPESYADLQAAGIDHDVVEPHRRWTISAATDDGAIDLSYEATGPALVLGPDHPAARIGGMEGYEQPCRVRGSIHLGAEHGHRRITVDGVGQRGHQWGAPDWSRMDLSRTITGWFDGGPSFAVTAMRPAGAPSHADEVSWAAIARVPPPEPSDDDEDDVAPDPSAPAEAVEAPEPRISTTTDAEGRHVQATVELWESDRGPVWTATGEAVAGNTLELGRLRLDTAFFRWRLAGREGVGRYDVLRKVD
ncbi:MAG: hypothetical protein M0P31_14910 [Solirubrobacteraceae bacterium]|nr:hypothetical protein [Solirubrobacteraceae bacterium]